MIVVTVGTQEKNEACEVAEVLSCETDGASCGIGN